ncbi:arsenic resistance protein [Microbulbifer sp. OS29]|uniref:Arsenic resistance protein n=1 Tax=Microbulbifer okhotskensis TaxID=2926617 RepID=A0A9X2J4A7_9GAMM|nr:SLC13 family permease [Microbulbifer okhotskensis]MCO1334347.1 arsenic resistance protein [Microbulbifer okhotskensis]
MSISLTVSTIIFLLIAARQWLPSAIRIWHIMTFGAIVLLGLRQITFKEAFFAVDWDLILYLFSVFSIASALYDTGISAQISKRILSRKSPNAILASYVLIMAICAALLTNDAAAVIGVPIALLMARDMKWGVVPLLILLCATVTIGSMVSPVGNPQNILIANAGEFDNMFFVFVEWIFIPAAITLVLSIFWLKRFLKIDDPNHAVGIQSRESDEITQKWPPLLSASLLIILIALGSVLHNVEGIYHPSLGQIGLAACLPIYLASRERRRILREVDWPTLFFFISMFVVTGSLLKSGSLQFFLKESGIDLSEPETVTFVSFFASQLFSNVPVVEIYLHLLHEHGTQTLMMLSAVSTAAGNLFIISAASNVIVLQQAEKFGIQPFNFWQFFLLMLPVSIISVTISYIYIIWYGSL